VRTRGRHERRAVNQSVRPKVSAALLASCSLALAACDASASAMSMNCDRFLAEDDASQREISAEWTDKNTKLSSEMPGVVAGSRGMLVEHCESNPTDRIGDLKIGRG
jgi:hypothetical protein